MKRSIQLLILFVFGFPIWAQPTATIVGRVTDSSGAVLGGAKIQARNVSTSLERSTVTTDSGDFELPSLPISGAYTLNLSKEGYITRHGKGTVAVVSPAGKVLQEIDVLGKMPTNICFGGPDGRTTYVTEAEQGRLVQFRADRPGLEW